MSKVPLRFIGDVHGRVKDYITLTEQAEHSIQVGDVGFDYSEIRKNLDPTKHRILGGNHDNYEEWEGKFILQPAHFLGDFGTISVPQVADFFFVRGGRSIDKEDRVPGRSWWPGEELSWSQMNAVVGAYKAAKPRFVVSHECPASIIPLVSGVKTWNGRVIEPSATAYLLEELLCIHQPQIWIFGHHHKSFREIIGETTLFICLAELETFDFKLMPDVG